eukprot:1160152-Pelagomonas_calceolata.AAC.4
MAFLGLLAAEVPELLGLLAAALVLPPVLACSHATHPHPQCALTEASQSSPGCHCRRARAHSNSAYEDRGSRPAAEAAAAQWDSAHSVRGEGVLPLPPASPAAALPGLSPAKWMCVSDTSMATQERAAELAQAAEADGSAAKGLGREVLGWGGKGRKRKPVGGAEGQGRWREQKVVELAGRRRRRRWDSMEAVEAEGMLERWCGWQERTGQGEQCCRLVVDAAGPALLWHS